MIYLDSSALVKLVTAEDETPALRSYLRSRATASRVSSGLARVEVVRAVRRVDPRFTAAAVAVCRRVDVVPVSPDLLGEASTLDPAPLRSLDAIHLASALRLAKAGLESFVAYDRQLLDAAVATGMPTLSPGV